jgi:hypothetical protein
MSRGKASLRRGMDNLVDRVTKTLAPYLGQVAARAALKMYFERSGVTPETIRVEHLEQIAETLKPGLRVFVGAAKADSLAVEIRSLDRGPR